MPKKGTPPPARPRGKGKVPPKGDGRGVIYPELTVELCVGDNALTAQNMKDLLGWEEESGNVKFGSDHMRDLKYGPRGKEVKVRLHNNSRNRRYDHSLARQYCQEVLTRNWADSRNGPPGERTINGETLVFGRTGECLSGQHRGIGLILAEWEWHHGEQADHWKELWPDGPPTMEALVVKGVSEHPRVIMTIDNVRPRDEADVFYTDPDLFKGKDQRDRDTLCRRLAMAVRVMWSRAGYGDERVNPYAPRRTNVQAVDFVARHPRLVECVQFVSDEDGKEGRLTKYLQTGTMAGLLYLLGSSASDGDEYRRAEPHVEKTLDWSNWDKACEFLVALASGGDEFKPVRLARRPLEGDRKGHWSGYVFARGSEGGSPSERAGVLIKAWGAFLAGRDATDDDVLLRYDEHYTDDGLLDYAVLLDKPTVGGIDMGESEEESGPQTDPTPEELEERKREERRRREGVRTVKADAYAKPQPEANGHANGKADAGGRIDARRALTKRLTEVKEEATGKVVFFRGADKMYRLWTNDAEYAGKVLGADPDPDPDTGLKRLLFTAKQFPVAAGKLVKARAKVAVCDDQAGGVVLTDWEPAGK